MTHTENVVGPCTDAGRVVLKVLDTDGLGGQCKGRSAGKVQHLGAARQWDHRDTDEGGLGDHQVQKEWLGCRSTPWLRPLSDQRGPAGTATPSAVATTRRGPVEVRRMEEEGELGWRGGYTNNIS